jgi:hypothetical protein
VISQDFAAPAALLPLAGFASYLRGTLRGTTRPSRVSWALWAAAPLIAFAAQVTEHTSLRLSLVTFVLGFGPALILAASFANPQAYWRLGRFDWACAAIATAALAAWAATRRGDVAIALAIAADLCAALPTIAKSWSHPASESSGTYIASGTGAAITLLTVRHWQFAACAFSAYVVAVCAVITVLIVLPRTAPARATAALAVAVVPLGAMAWAGLHIAAILLPAQPSAITPTAVAQPPHASRSVPVTRRERRLATAPQQAPLPPPAHSPAAKPTLSRSRRPARSPRPSPRPSPTSKRSPSPSSTSPYPSPSPTRTSPYPSPSPTSTDPYPSPTTTAPSPSPTRSPSPYPSATASPSPTPSPTASYPSPTT